MNDDLHPDDPFERGLGDRMHAAADGIDGRGVTRSAIAARADRTRRLARTRIVLAGAAAAVVLVAGAAMVRAGDGPEHLSTAGTSTSTTADPCAPPSPKTWVGWLDITHPQADALVEAGLITWDDAPRIGGTLHHLNYEEYQVLVGLSRDPVGKRWSLTGEQIFELGSRDPETGELDPDRVNPPTGPLVLTEGQRSVLSSIIDLDADDAPDLTPGAHVYLTWDQLKAIQEYEVGLDARQADALTQGAFPGPVVPVPGYDPIECVDTTAVADPEATSTAPGATSTTTTTEVGGPDSTTAVATTTTVDPRRPEGWPTSIQPQDALGQRLWAVYIDAWSTVDPSRTDVSTTTSADGHDEVAAGEDRWWDAEARAAAYGYLTGIRRLSCDEGALPRGLDPPIDDDRPGAEVWGVPVYFEAEVDARRFSALLPGSEADVVQVRILSC